MGFGGGLRVQSTGCWFIYQPRKLSSPFPLSDPDDDLSLRFFFLPTSDPHLGGHSSSRIIKVELLIAPLPGGGALLPWRRRRRHIRREEIARPQPDSDRFSTLQARETDLCVSPPRPLQQGYRCFYLPLKDGPYQSLRKRV